MTIKSPTEALEHISPLDGHHSALLAVFSVQHPLRISQAASSGCWGGGASWAGLWSRTHFVLAFLTHKLVCYLGWAGTAEAWFKGRVLSRAAEQQSFDGFRTRTMTLSVWFSCAGANMSPSMGLEANGYWGMFSLTAGHQLQRMTVKQFHPPCQHPETSVPASCFSSRQTTSLTVSSSSKFPFVWHGQTFHCQRLDGSSEMFGHVSPCLSNIWCFVSEEETPHGFFYNFLFSHYAFTW